MTTGDMMRTVLIEALNVDEDLAEKAVRESVIALSTIVELNNESLQVEPHDDVRGVQASFILNESDNSQSFGQAVASALKALINIRLHMTNKATIKVTVRTEKGE
jgi:hypothetical protein